MKTTSNSSPLAAVHRHQLHCLLALAGLMLAGLQRGVGEEGNQRPTFADGTTLRRPQNWPPH
jgi:hypothetical protein